MNKKLKLSDDKKIFGVCGGLAEYFNVDPTLMRAVYVILTVCTGFSGTLVYLILYLIIPSHD